MAARSGGARYRAACVTALDITLEPDSVEPGSAIRGVVEGAPPAGVVLAVKARQTTPFDESVAELHRAELGDGPFEIDGPNWPPSSSGPLLTVDWFVEAIDRDGESLGAAPFTLVTGSLRIESPSNDDLDAPARRSRWRVALVTGLILAVAVFGVVTALFTGEAIVRVLSGIVAALALVPFAGAMWGMRDRSVFGHVRCRVDLTPGGLECVVRANPQNPESAGAMSATATLYVAEEATWSRGADMAPETREELLAEVPVELVRVGSAGWRGTIPLDGAAGLPPSRSNRRGAVSFSVSWAVTFAIAASSTPDFRRALPLLALPVRLPDGLGPNHVSIPTAAG